MFNRQNGVALSGRPFSMPFPQLLQHLSPNLGCPIVGRHSQSPESFFFPKIIPAKPIPHETSNLY